MSNVVVTGGYGFIGSHLVSALLDRGDSVTVFDFAKNTRDTSIDFDRHPNFRFVQGDVTDISALERALARTSEVTAVFADMDFLRIAGWASGGAVGLRSAKRNRYIGLLRRLAR